MKGKPVLKAIAEDCLYEFDWPTNILCPEHAIDLRPASCGVFSNETNIEFDLKTITDNGNIVVRFLEFFNRLKMLNVVPNHSQVNHSPNNYTVNLCNNPSSSVLVNYAESTVKLFFQTKGPCDPEGIYIQNKNRFSYFIYNFELIHRQHRRGTSAGLQGDYKLFSEQ